MEQLEQTFVKLIDEVESINKMGIINHKKLEELLMLGVETAIGKRNVNCLTCSPDKNLVGEPPKLLGKQSSNEYYTEKAPEISGFND